jgi:sugar-phosphatase
MQIAQGTLITTRALLFDMDGTLVDSTAAVERIWGRWARRHGVSYTAFAHRLHGRRAIDTMREVVPPGLDAEQEVRQIDAEELDETDGIVAIAGAAELIAQLPAGSWALVTSARPALAAARMSAAGLPLPEIVVTSADVSQGKPDPACYLRALERLRLAAENALVFEDAPAGLAAAHAAGCPTIALATTTPSAQLDHEDWLHDLRTVVLHDVLRNEMLQLRCG